MQGWTGWLEHGATDRQVVAGLLGSTEYLQRAAAGGPVLAEGPWRRSDPLAAGNGSGPLLPLGPATGSGESITITRQPNLTSTEGKPLLDATLATLTDSDGLGGTYQATITWGDGTANSTGTVTVVGNTVHVSGSHTYTSAGSDTITVTLTDDGSTSTPGNSATATIPVTVTGGGGNGEPFPDPPDCGGG